VEDENAKLLQLTSTVRCHTRSLEVKMIPTPLENLGQLDGTANKSEHLIAPCQDYIDPP